MNSLLRRMYAKRDVDTRYLIRLYQQSDPISRSNHHVQHLTLVAALKHRHTTLLYELFAFQRQYDIRFDRSWYTRCFQLYVQFHDAHYLHALLEHMRATRQLPLLAQEVQYVIHGKLANDELESAMVLLQDNLSQDTYVRLCMLCSQYGHVNEAIQVAERHLPRHLAVWTHLLQHAIRTSPRDTVKRVHQRIQGLEWTHHAVHLSHGMVAALRRRYA
jgi:hypothetical protein